jgi:2-dehydro-3-deoxyphosphogluconate aldolase/(4S)-4-hydroxy-2-oxoglutarate aldolase
MNDTGAHALRDRIRASAIIAVLVIEDAEDAIPLARALLRGGVDAMELALRTPAAFAALQRIVDEVPEMLAGVGTILDSAQVREAKARGAAFGVAPGMNPGVVDAAIESGLPFAPGIATPSEIEAAYQKGCRIMKFFPAEPSGGLAYLRSVNAPYAHLGISYIPLGGLCAENLGSYLECPEIIAVGGSWLATRDLVRARDWDGISRNCEEALAIAARARGI